MTPILVIVKKKNNNKYIDVSFFVDPFATLVDLQHFGHIMAQFYHQEQDSLKMLISICLLCFAFVCISDHLTI